MVPITSAGSRSGVNWIRENSMRRHSATVRTARVFAGTGSRAKLPRPPPALGPPTTPIPPPFPPLAGPLPPPPNQHGGGRRVAPCGDRPHRRRPHRDALILQRRHRRPCDLTPARLGEP